MRDPDTWEYKWKRFLYEGMSAQAIDADELSKVFDYFHISDQKLSKDDFFTFTPRRPRYPYADWQGNITEDDFTKRISVAPSISDAITSLEGNFEHVEGWAHLYAGVGNPDAETKVEDCPESPDNEYGKSFFLVPWLRQKMVDGELDIEDAQDLGLRIPPGLWPPGFEDPKWNPNEFPTDLRPTRLPAHLRDEFEGCVPDADETHEEWLLKPTKLIYIGEIEIDTREVILSNAGLKAVKQAGLETYSF